MNRYDLIRGGFDYGINAIPTADHPLVWFYDEETSAYTLWFYDESQRLDLLYTLNDAIESYVIDGDRVDLNLKVDADKDAFAAKLAELGFEAIDNVPL